jgi:hypothetical protein
MSFSDADSTRSSRQQPSLETDRRHRELGEAVAAQFVGASPQERGPTSPGGELSPSGARLIDLERRARFGRFGFSKA